MAARIRLVVTDLDGTLLDHATYAFEPALPAIRALQARGIPLVFCTSKTFVETVALQERLDIWDPFIVENGGALYVPPGWPMASGRPARKAWERLALGVPRERVIRFLRAFRERTGARLRGFSDLSLDEVCQATELARPEAERALQREFDEPFLLDPSEDLPRLVECARSEGWELTTGGRFHHLSGGTDKGRAVRILCRRLLEGGDGGSSVGLGDSPNDASMLAAVDLPVVVPHPGGAHDRELLTGFPWAIRAPAPGPAGWAAVILALLEVSDASG